MMRAVIGLWLTVFSWVTFTNPPFLAAFAASVGLSEPVFLLVAMSFAGFVLIGDDTGMFGDDERHHWHTRTRTVTKGDFTATLNGVDYNIKIEDNEAFLKPIKAPTEEKPPESTLPATPMDNVLVRLQRQITTLTRLENAPVDETNTKLYQDVFNEVTEIGATVNGTQELRDSEQRVDFDQAYNLANELIISVGTRFPVPEEKATA